MKKYLLLFLTLIIVIPIVLFFIKHSSLKTQYLKSDNASVSTVKKGFIASNEMSFPNGMSFTKAMNAKEDIGKNALYYDYNPIGLDGEEWVSTVKVNTPSEYEKKLKDFHNFYNLKIHKDGWSNQQTVDTHNLQPLAAVSPRGEIYGYLKHLNGDIQTILFYDQKDSDTFPANVQFRVFLSKVYPLNEIVE